MSTKKSTSVSARGAWRHQYAGNDVISTRAMTSSVHGGSTLVTTAGRAAGLTPAAHLSRPEPSAALVSPPPAQLGRSGLSGALNRAPARLQDTGIVEEDEINSPNGAQRL